MNDDSNSPAVVGGAASTSTPAGADALDNMRACLQQIAEMEAFQAITRERHKDDGSIPVPMLS